MNDSPLYEHEFNYPRYDNYEDYVNYRKRTLV